MKCAVHSEVDAVGYCRNCGKALCSACVRPVRDVLYCEDCLATLVGIPSPEPRNSAYLPATGAPGAPPPAASGGRAGSPPVAFILAFLFPGLGAVYNGEYNKALIHIVVFATFVFGLSSDLDGGMKAVLGILLAGLIFYTAFDSMRTAEARRRGEAMREIDRRRIVRRDERAEYADEHEHREHDRADLHARRILGSTRPYMRSTAMLTST